MFLSLVRTHTHHTHTHTHLVPREPLAAPSAANSLFPSAGLAEMVVVVECSLAVAVEEEALLFAAALLREDARGGLHFALPAGPLTESALLADGEGFPMICDRFTPA